MYTMSLNSTSKVDLEPHSIEGSNSAQNRDDDATRKDLSGPSRTLEVADELPGTVMPALAEGDIPTTTKWESGRGTLITSAPTACLFSTLALRPFKTCSLRLLPSLASSNLLADYAT